MLDAFGDDNDLLTRLTKALRTASFVVVDITPKDLPNTETHSSAIPYNPNVMFELGRAVELRVPTFAICDRQILSFPHKLPFDINTTEHYDYDLNPQGLKGLAERFETWLSKEYLSHYEVVLPRFQDLDRIRLLLSNWKKEHIYRFGPIVAVLLKRILSHSVDVANIESAHKSELLFEPLTPQEMVDAIFQKTLKAMQEHDSYDTVSTLEFWENIGASRRSQFMEETEPAYERKVTIRRLFLIEEAEISRVTDRVEVQLLEHEAIRDRAGESYKLGYLVVPTHDSYMRNRSDYHVTVCRIASEEFVLQPHYASDPKREKVLIAVNYILDPEHAHPYSTRIANLWKEAERKKNLFSSWAEIKNQYLPQPPG